MTSGRLDALRAFYTEMSDIIGVDNGAKCKVVMDAYAAFCKAEAEEPLQETVRALTRQVEVLQGRLEKVELQAVDRSSPPLRPHTLDGTEPYQVYVIEGRRKYYIGRALAGFLYRYPKGEWWVGHHNEALMRDLHFVGAANFKVTIYQCHSADDASGYERQLYDYYFPNVFNAVRP